MLSGINCLTGKQNAPKYYTNQKSFTGLGSPRWAGLGQSEAAWRVSGRALLRQPGLP